MTYSWNRLSFDLPDRIDDETVLLFTDQRDPPRYSLTVTRDALGAGASVGAYADGALAELKADVDGYEAVARKDRKVGKKGDLTAVEIEHVITLGGQSSRQLQVYAAVAGGVAVVTMTANDDGMLDGRACLEKVVGSLATS